MRARRCSKACRLWLLSALFVGTQAFDFVTLLYALDLSKEYMECSSLKVVENRETVIPVLAC